MAVANRSAAVARSATTLVSFLFERENDGQRQQYTFDNPLSALGLARYDHAMTQRRWRRVAVRCALLLAAGAAVNVAVAWTACIMADRWTGTREALFESFIQFDTPLAKSRLQYMAAVREITPIRTRFSILYLGGGTGSWTQVHNLDEEVPEWADVYLSDESLTQLRKHRGNERIIEAAGWPRLALSGCVVNVSPSDEPASRFEWSIVLPSRSASSGKLRALPLRPMWSGFTINTLFYAGVLWMIFFVPFAVRRWFRHSRGKSGLCPACAYPIGTSDVCTECGATVNPKGATP